MFEVTAISGRLPTKLIELTAIEEMTGVHRLLSAGQHDSQVYECPYHFPLGAKMILELAPWKRLKVGDRMDLSTVLRHPSVEAAIFRKSSKGGWETAGSR